MFKVGDKVVCVDNECSLLNLGEIYTVGKVNESYIYLTDITLDGAYYKSRFKLASDIDPLVEIRQSEYDGLIEEINLLQELLAEANIKLAKLDFKPVAEYTLEDWEQAVYNNWMFEQRNGDIVTVNALDDADETTYPVDTDNAWLTLSGREYLNVQSACDILRRIK